MRTLGVVEVAKIFMNAINAGVHAIESGVYSGKIGIQSAHSWFRSHRFSQIPEKMANSITIMVVPVPLIVVTNSCMHLILVAEQHTGY